MTMRRIGSLVIAALLGATAVPALAQAQEKCENCGRVESVREYTAKTGWTPLGATASAGVNPGAADAGRVSTQYNFSTGNVVLLGAAGGAGYAKRPNSYERPRWEIAVRMDDGSRRTVTHDYEPVMQAGDRVRVYGTQLELM
jgi:outer membrane lipoprotein SlyB